MLDRLETMSSAADASAPQEIATPVRVRLDLAYDGAAYHGWAAQPGLRTVEGALREGLATLIRREVPVVVAGRTDSGVHARGQVVHFDLSAEEWAGLSRGRDIAPQDALLRRIAGVLARQEGAVVVRAARRVPPAFDARFSALSRSYSYRIVDDDAQRDPLSRGHTVWHRRGLDVTLMDAEAALVAGLHDFASFCRPRETGTTVRELQNFRIRRDADGAIIAELTADAFCHHMVRALVGACLEVGEGRRAPGWLAERLGRRSWDAEVRLAPPHGLVLEAVSYPPEDQLAARAARTRALRDAPSAGGAPGQT